jgi:hypothetical protein
MTKERSFLEAPLESLFFPPETMSFHAITVLYPYSYSYKVNNVHSETDNPHTYAISDAILSAGAYPSPLV